MNKTRSIGSTLVDWLCLLIWMIGFFPISVWLVYCCWKHPQEYDESDDHEVYRQQQKEKRDIELAKGSRGGDPGKSDIEL